MASGAEGEGSRGQGICLQGLRQGNYVAWGDLFHPQNKEMEGEKSQKTAPKGPSSALLAERREFMAVPDPQ